MIMSMFRGADTHIAIQDTKFADFFSSYAKSRNVRGLLLLETEAVKLRDEYYQQVEFSRLMVMYYRDRLTPPEDFPAEDYYYIDYIKVMLDKFNIWDKWYSSASINDAAYQCTRQFVIRCQEIRDVLDEGKL